MGLNALDESHSRANLPKQARARETYERLITAAQIILEEGGLEALNSNAVAAQAGTTPPSFYRYFGNKYDLLAELGRRLMNAQNSIIERRAGEGGPERYSQRAMEAVLAETLRVTRAYRGGRAIISSLRAVPELSPIRLESHAYIARLMAREISAGKRGKAKAEMYVRARLAVELGYAAIEMLLEVQGLDERRVLESAARAITAGLS